MAQNRKIIVAFFLPSLEPGGTERNVVNLINAVDREHYAAFLVLGKKEGDFIKEVHGEIPVISLDAPYSLGLFFALVKYLRSHQSDILVSAFPRVNIICIAAKIFSRSSVRIIITEHSVFSMLPVIAKTPWRRIFAKVCMPILARWLYPKADAIACVSEGIAQDLFKTVNVHANIIHNPIIDDRIYHLAKEPVSHAWFTSQNMPVILAAGRLVKTKDYPTLLRAFALVLQKIKAHLVILGRGPEEESLKGLADSLGLSDAVVFLGFQENPFRYMAKASVFALSSIQEGFGNVIIEAMACGLPVVSTDCPVGPGEIIEHMKNGILVPVGDEKSLAQAMVNIVSDPLLARRFCMEGKARALDFSIEKSVREYEKIFEKFEKITR